MWSTTKLAAAAVDAARAGEVDWRGAVAARFLALTGGVVPRGLDAAVLERFLAYQAATEVCGRVTPYTAAAFDGVPLVPWSEVVQPEKWPVRDPFTGEALDSAGHNPARDRDFPIADAVAMDAIGYFAARAPKLDPTDEDAVHEAVHGAIAAVACARTAAKDKSDLRSLIRGSALVRPSLRTIAQEVSVLVLAPDGPQAAEVRLVARARGHQPSVAIGEAEAQRRGLGRQAALEDQAPKIDGVPTAKRFFVIAANDPKHAGYFRELRAHLATSVRLGKITLSSVFDYPAGANVAARFERSLSEADAVVVMVSSATVADCEAHIERACASGKRVVPVLVSACIVPEHLETKVLLPRSARPVASYPDRDEPWSQVAVELRAIADRPR
jgi:hypothetical protein